MSNNNSSIRSKRAEVVSRTELSYLTLNLGVEYSIQAFIVFIHTGCSCCSNTESPRRARIVLGFINRLEPYLFIKLNFFDYF